jgi:hypothetical protein
MRPSKLQDEVIDLELRLQALNNQRKTLKEELGRKLNELLRIRKRQREHKLLVTAEK